MSSFATEHFIETLTTLIDERVQVALDSNRTPVQETDGWLDTTEAAVWLSVPRSRIYDLVSMRKLTPARDGTRLKFKRSDLDAYVEGTV